MDSRDIYIKLTDPTGKHKPVVNAHRVWDGVIDQRGECAG